MTRQKYELRLSRPCPIWWKRPRICWVMIHSLAPSMRDVEMNQSWFVNLHLISLANIYWLFPAPLRNTIRFSRRVCTMKVSLSGNLWWRSFKKCVRVPKPITVLHMMISVFNWFSAFLMKRRMWSDNSFSTRSNERGSLTMLSLVAANWHECSFQPLRKSLALSMMMKMTTEMWIWRMVTARKPTLALLNLLLLRWKVFLVRANIQKSFVLWSSAFPMFSLVFLLSRLSKECYPTCSVWRRKRLPMLRATQSLCSASVLTCALVQLDWFSILTQGSPCRKVVTTATKKKEVVPRLLHPPLPTRAEVMERMVRKKRISFALLPSSRCCMLFPRLILVSSRIILKPFSRI